MHIIEVEKMFITSTETILKHMKPVLGHCAIMNPWKKLQSDSYRLELPISISKVPIEVRNKAMKLWDYVSEVKSEQDLEFILNSTVELFHNSDTIKISIELYSTSVINFEGVYSQKRINFSSDDSYICQKIAELKALIHNSIYLILKDDE
ncbi:hypothetical protein [Bacillus toyonensis]|uniref:hypothetical protein n=1 Tax=Bacillus toyonensis TaxID=155322 RepID=UPI002E21F59B|nr:hypothetical protein [Bacillus toyonensis]